MKENIINMVNEVTEVDSIEQVNKLLAEGWILLAAVGQSHVDGIHGTRATILYSLGSLI